MKKQFIKLAVPVLLASFVTLSVSAQTQPAATKAAAPATSTTAKQSKEANVTQDNKEYSSWEQRFNQMKTKEAKNAAVQGDLNKIQADLAGYKSAIAGYSSATASANSEKANEQVKSAHEKLMTDWNNAKSKLGETKKPATTPAK